MKTETLNAHEIHWLQEVLKKQLPLIKEQLSHTILSEADVNITNVEMGLRNFNGEAIQKLSQLSWNAVDQPGADFLQRTLNFGFKVRFLFAYDYMANLSAQSDWRSPMPLSYTDYTWARLCGPIMQTYNTWIRASEQPFNMGYLNVDGYIETGTKTSIRPMRSELVEKIDWQYFLSAFPLEANSDIYLDTNFCSIVLSFLVTRIKLSARIEKMF